MIAEIGALNFIEEGMDRRAALWQIEKSRRPKGPLWEDKAATEEVATGSPARPSHVRTDTPAGSPPFPTRHHGDAERTLPLSLR